MRPWNPNVIETSRLRLRDWTDGDLPAFAAMNADPRVMEYLPQVLTGAQSDELGNRIRENLQRRGFGLWAVEIIGGEPFIGFVGLSVPNFQARFTPCVEVGWRLAHGHWGNGYATEAGATAIQFGFENAGLEKIVSFTTAGNARSRRVMERLGMSHSPADDFEHPGLPADHPLLPHVLYTLSRAAWNDRVHAPCQASR